MHYVRMILCFFYEIIHSRWLIIELAKKDFKSRYLGSYLGILWAFIQPLITIMIFWFVFQVGFKSAPVDNIPYILWLVSGMFPWFFLSDSISNGTMAIMEHSYLVKKVVFRISILPLVKIVSALVIHVFFIGLMFFMFSYYGYYPHMVNFQVVYYLFAGICLVLGISWITSTLVVFLRDIGQLVTMLLQFAFWGTPIFWSIKIIPIQYQKWVALNPAYYVIEGYRNAMIYQRWFWEDFSLTCYFWGVVIVINLIGVVLFKKLRPHFADVI